jgi:hypothetical protein
LLNVLTAIQFNGHARFQAGKVANVWSDRVLAAKLETGHLVPPQTTPQQALSLGGIFSEVSGEAKHCCIGSFLIGRNEAKHATVECTVLL